MALNWIPEAIIQKGIQAFWNSVIIVALIFMAWGIRWSLHLTGMGTTALKIADVVTQTGFDVIIFMETIKTVCIFIPILNKENGVK